DALEEKEYVFKDGDIYKMHTYKDSILLTEGSYVLYPGNRTKQFLETNTIIPSVGAFSLTPGNEGFEENDLENFIKKVIKTLLYYRGLVNLEFISS
ncbi:MAG: nuclease domain-containing protein, partial [Methanobrevibacter sp.]|nr:nuclease domain-containing protein [Methanobrevibacter sp.]